MPGLLERLRESPVLLADGAWGSMFIEQGLDFSREPAEAWNLHHPERVAGLAHDYAGSADILTTNTFGANRIRLAQFGLERELHLINTRGVEIARRAGHTRDGREMPVLIGGAMGPARGPGAATPDDCALAAVFGEQAACLLEAGADFLLLETMTDLEEARIAVRATRAVGARAVVCSFGFREAQPGIFTTWSGHTVEAALDTALEAGADMAGANCVPATESLLSLIESIRRHTGSRPLWIKPNAGQPVRSEQNAAPGCPVPLWRYPHWMTDGGLIGRILDILGHGVFGGCCGATPSDIAMIRRELDRPAARRGRLDGDSV